MMPMLYSCLMKRLVCNPPEPLRVVILMFAVLAYGASGFLYFELPGNPDLTWGDGLWFTVVTMATVGYGDLFPKTPAGRFLVGWPVMFVGIGSLGYALSLMAAKLVTSKTKEVRGMSSFKLQNHLVIVNFPGAAKVLKVLEELRLDRTFDQHERVVLVDEHLEELPPELQKRGMLFVRGNPARDETLTRASLDQAAHAIVLCRTAGDPASDNLNVAITLAIEARCRSVDTVVECADPASEELLRKAGCDRVVCASRFEALFVSQELLNPGIQEVVTDLFSARGGQQIYFTPVPRAEPFEELSRRCQQKGHLVLGLGSSTGVRLNITERVTVAAGDRVITIGPSRLEAL